MIDPNTIRRIFDTADIYEVVSDFVRLKKRGVNYVGCCPFHDEKTASFTVSPSKGIYKCFGCGKGGNVVNFVMEHEQFTYVEALKYLGAKYHIPIEEKELSEEERREKSERESMLIVTSYARDYFVRNLWDTDEGRSVGLGYFRSRGLSDEMIKRFELGYSPRKRNALAVDATADGYKRDFLIKTGLVIASERGDFDRFHERVIFPIRDMGGKVIAFGGRIMTSEKTAKYLNSPESEIYHKSNTLYGIYFARQQIMRADRCYLVEGYLDVISFHQLGISNTVASSGTSLTVEQIRTVRRLTPNITIIYDGDKAGIRASLRGIDMLLSEGMNVRVLALPEGEDPDSFARVRDIGEVEAYISENEADFIVFMTRFLVEAAGDDPVKRAGAIREIVDSISRIPDGIVRTVYIREAAAVLNMGEKILFSEVNRNIRQRLGDKRSGKSSRKEPYSTDKGGYFDTAVAVQPERNLSGIMPDAAGEDAASYCETEERMLIRFLLLYGDKCTYPDEEENIGNYIIRELDADELELFSPPLRKIVDEYRAHAGEADFSPSAYFIKSEDNAISRIVADILSEPYELSAIWKTSGGEESERGETGIGEFLPKVINLYKLRRLELMIKETDRDILKAQNEGNEEVLMDKVRRKTLLSRMRRAINESIGYNGIG